MAVSERKAVFRAAAQDPTTAPDHLKKIVDYFPLLVASNPNTSKETLSDLLHNGKGLRLRSGVVSGWRLDFAISWAICENPNFDMLALEDPNWGRTVQNAVTSNFYTWQMASLPLCGHRQVVAELLAPWEMWLQENGLDPSGWLSAFRQALHVGDWPKRFRVYRGPGRCLPTPFIAPHGKGSRQKRKLLALLRQVVSGAMSPYTPCNEAYTALGVMALLHAGQGAQETLGHQILLAIQSRQGGRHEQ